jgi:creatinine amidohydrolase/Fe(II)-dependent formamide hydrolase-like protein
MWRTPEDLRAWGFREDERVYGMRFPDVPLCSEHCEVPEMAAAVRNRLNALRGSGFRHAFLVNHHGGRGQFATLDALAEELSADGFHVHALRTYQFSDLKEESLRVGGHAGLSETTWVMAFRPELVDLMQQADGELSVRRTGILHGTPTIEAQWNPRHASMAVACALRERVVENFLRTVRDLAGLRTIEGEAP